MNDDRIDEMLAQGARDYNQPGRVPREEMWARIQASRREHLTVAQTSRSRPLWVAPSVGIAAAAILAVGIVIGRRLERATPSTVAVAAQNTPNTQNTATTAKTDSTPALVAERSAPVASRDSLIQKLREETKKTDRHARELVATSKGSSSEQQPAENNLAYRLVVLQHLEGSEAMITAFRTAARRGELDAQLANWSRELLSTTRMLEASAATEDPTMKRLLEDLDLVIAQIVQYVTHGTNNSEELDLIERSITTRGVITKLRSTVSARNTSGT